MEERASVGTSARKSTPGAGGAQGDWISKESLCETLDVSPRTVDRMVRRGELVRRRVGRESQFRVIDASRTPANSVEGTAQALAKLDQQRSLESAQQYIAQLVGVVDRLAERVANLERERAELRAELTAATARVAAPSSNGSWSQVTPS